MVQSTFGFFNVGWQSVEIPEGFAPREFAYVCQVLVLISGSIGQSESMGLAKKSAGRR